MDSSDEEEVESSSFSLTREALFNIIKQSRQKNIDAKLKFLVNELEKTTKCPKDKISLLNESLKSFKHFFKAKWVAASYKENRFCETNKQWLSESITIPTWVIPRVGRPAKEFSDSSERTKRRKTKEIRTSVAHEKLTYAASMSERAAGNTELSKLIQDASETPTRAKKFRKVINSAKRNQIVKLSPSEALAKFVEGELTRHQYNVLRTGLESIFPCYSLLQREKAKCYPKDIHISENLAEVKLQNLLDHTAQRLLKYLEDVMVQATNAEMEHLKLICKWGCDGSKQQEYKQKFGDSSNSDAHVFISSLVPLRLQSEDGGLKKVWWQNPAPSSARFCRPIRIRYAHETTDLTQKEIADIEGQAKNLVQTEIDVADKCAKVKHVLLLTMVDGKVCNAATCTTSTMRCYICKQTSKEFNSLKKVDDSAIDPSSLRFGLSILHARIRFYETILHIAYKLPFAKWRLNPDEKAASKKIQKKIQVEFQKETGLLVDMPKTNFGNTNDGNSSRRFFSDPETAARITGVDLNLIKKLGLILEVLSSGYPIDTIKFGAFLENTAEYYVNTYSWCPMTPTLHKILMHGTLVINHAILPIGQLSEEAAEARNKHFREYRKNFARKFSRTDCNTDIMNRLLLSSDVLLSCNRNKIKRKQQPLSHEALEFLLPDVGLSTSTDEVDIDSD